MEKININMTLHNEDEVPLKGDRRDTTLRDLQERWMQEGMHVNVGFNNITSFCDVQHHDVVVDSFPWCFHDTI